MAICNLFNEFTNYSGNFLMFSQYVEDITQNFTKNDSNYRVIPSRFVALDIDYLNLDDSVFGLGEDPTITDDLLNKGIPKYFQNYFENGCAYGRSPEREIEDSNWKWTPEKSKNLFWNAMWDGKFLTSYKKDDDKIEEVINEVMYYGDINMHSYNEHKGMGYGEIYCYIPTDGNQKYCQVIKRENRESLKNSNNRLEGLNDINNFSKYYYYNTDFLMSFNDDGVQDINIKSSHKYDINTIVVLYDIFERLNDEWVTVYSDIPLGMYVAGKFVDGKLSNTITKYVTTSYGTGTSYGLRICTRFSVSPSGTILNTHEVSVDENYVNFCQLMVGMNENLSKMMDVVKSSNDTTQQYKDFLSIIKNNRTNVPYVRNVNGDDCWFINGRYVSKVAGEPTGCLTLTKNEINNHINGLPNNICSCDEVTAKELANVLGMIIDENPEPEIPIVPPSCSCDCEDYEFASDKDVVDYLRNTTISRLKINPSIKTLFLGEEFKLEALFDKIPVSDNCRWRSDTTYVTVDNTGKIVGNSIGNAIITAEYDTDVCCEDRKFLGKCKVFVINNGEIGNMKIEASKSTIDIKESIQAKAIFYTTLNGKVTNSYDVTDICAWESSNPKVASISTNGKITGESGGMAMICAKHDNEITSFVVNVNPEDSISLSKNLLNYTSSSYGQYVIVNASKNFTISNSVDWLTINQSGSIVNLTVMENTSETDRSATVKFTCGKASAELRVNQKGKEVYIPPVIVKALERISLSSKTITGDKNTSFVISVTAYYSDGTNSIVTPNTIGYSDNTTVATYSGGIVSLKNSGTANINISYTDGGVTKSENLTVMVKEENKKTYDFKLTPKNPSVYVGESVEVKFEIYEVLNGTPTNVTSKIPVYTILSGNSYVDIANTTEDNTVVFKGLKEGVATIQCFYKDEYIGSDSIFVDNFTITVLKKDEIQHRLILSEESVSLQEGRSIDLFAKLYTYTNGKKTGEENVTASCIWSSSNVDIVSIIDNESNPTTLKTVKAISTGNAIVTATYGDYEAVCNFDVQSKPVVNHYLEVILHDPITNEDTVYKDTIVLMEGDEIVLTVKYIKKVDGKVTTETDVTNLCNYNFSNTYASFDKNTGILLANSAGPSILNIEYSGNSESGKLQKVVNLLITEEPIIQMSISNLKEIVVNKWGQGGYNEKIIIIDRNGEEINTNLNYNLFYNGKEISYVITGTLREWIDLYELYGYTKIFLADSVSSEIISEELEDGHWDTINDNINAAKNTKDDQIFSINWPVNIIEKDPIITLTIENLEGIVKNTCGEMGVDSKIYIVDSSNNVIGNYLFSESNLYYYNGTLNNSIIAKTSDWRRFYKDYSNSDIFLAVDFNGVQILTHKFNAIPNVSSENFNKLYNTILTAENTKEDQKLEVIWTFDEKERYSYKLVVKEQGKSIEDSTHALYVGEKLQLEAIHYTYINGEIHDEYESDVSNDMKTIWTVYNNIIGIPSIDNSNTVIKVDAGLVTTVGKGSVYVRASYGETNAEEYYLINVSEPDSISVSPTSLTVNAGGGAQSIGISGTGKFIIDKKNTANWISFGVTGNKGSYDSTTGIYTSASNAETFNFSVGSNISAESRSTTLKIVLEDNTDKYVNVYITQAGDKQLESINTIIEGKIADTDGVFKLSKDDINTKFKLNVFGKYSGDMIASPISSSNYDVIIKDESIINYSLGQITPLKGGITTLTVKCTYNGNTVEDTITIQVGDIDYRIATVPVIKDGDKLQTGSSIKINKVYLQTLINGEQLNTDNVNTVDLTDFPTFDPDISLPEVNFGDDITNDCTITYTCLDGVITHDGVSINNIIKPGDTITGGIPGDCTIKIDYYGPYSNNVPVQQTFKLTIVSKS